MRLRFSLLLMFALILVPALAGAVAVPERPSQYVVDQAGVIDGGIEARINGFLRELEQKTSAQFLVLTIPSLEGAAIDDFSLQVAERWKLGQKGKDNGLLLLVALKDRKYRFEVGYGLEGVLPDSLVGSIGRDYIVPLYRQGDYSNGTIAAVLAAANVIATDSGVKITGMPKLRKPARGSRSSQPVKPTLGGTILSILFFIGVVYMFIKHPRFMLMMVMMSAMGGRRSAWGGGGGFGGGGFGGGGGGGFGGGGASGGW